MEDMLIIDGVLKSYDGTSSEVIVPSGVKIIAARAFIDNEYIKTVILPDSLQEIGHRAFSGCKKLKNLKLPKGVIDIGESAFLGCDSLADSDGFVIFDNVLYCYAGTSTTVRIPDSVTQIDPSTFNEAYDLRTLDIVVPKSVTKIDSTIFSNTQHSSVKLLGDYNRIEDETFSECIFLEDVGLPDTVTEIGKRAFSGCTSLETITLPAGLKRIEECAFINSELNSITFPDSLEYIGDSAFWGCKYLEEVTIPASVNFVGNNAFQICRNLRKIIIEDINILDKTSKPYAAVAIAEDYESADAFRKKTHMSYIENNVVSLCDMAIRYQVLLDFLMEHKIIRKKHMSAFLQHVDVINDSRTRIKLVDYEVNELSDDGDDLKDLFDME